MAIRKANFIQVMLVVLLMSLFMGVAWAQEPPPEEPAVVFDEDGRITITFDDIDERVVLQGTRQADRVFIDFPVDWNVEEDIDFTILYTASELLKMGRSTLTVSVNGTPITSINPIGDGLPQQFTFTAPATLFDPEEDFIRIDFNGALFVTDDVCELPNEANWLQVMPESNFKITPQIAGPPTLERLSNVLIPRDDITLENLPLLFIVPSYEDRPTLDVATQIALRLGNEAFGAVTDLLVRTPDDVTNEELATSEVILIGMPEDVPLIETVLAPLNLIDATGGALLDSIGNTVPETEGVVHVFSSPWNENSSVLILSGNSEEALNRTAEAFSNSDIYATLEGPSAFIGALDATVLPVVLEEEIIPPWTTDTTSFADLGLGDRLLDGIAPFTTVQRVFIPRGTVLQEGAQFTLRANYSPLEPGSHINVSVNDLFLGNIDTSEGDRVTQVFDLPVAELNEILSRRNDGRLEFTFTAYNVADIEFCQIVEVETFWTRIEDTSSVTATFAPIELPNMRQYPYPFINDPNGYPSVIILPSDVTGEDVANGLWLAMSLGNDMREDTQLSMFAIDNPPEQRVQGHYIVLGETARRSWIDLEYPGLENDEVSPSLGIVWTFESRLNPELMVLLVTGETPELYNASVRALAFGGGDERREFADFAYGSQEYFAVEYNPPVEELLEAGQ